MTRTMGAMVISSIRPAVVAAVLAGGFGGCLNDPVVVRAAFGYTPAQLSDGWAVSSPAAVGFDPDAIQRVYERCFSVDYFPTLRSLLIVRNGALVAEGYFRNPSDRDEYHALQSVTKSVTSILTGIAIDRGFLTSVDQSIYEFLPQYFDNDVRKRAITLHHVLTHQTGLDFDNDRNTNEFFNYDGSSLEYVLHKSLAFEPGTMFYYNDGNPQLISGVIQAVAGTTLERFAVQHLFDPLGIDNYKWEIAADGLTFGAFGLWITPREMAKLGKLMLDDGSWEGERIVSSEWITQSTRIYANGNYGYYWWIEEPNVFFWAQGFGDQIIYVRRDEELVIVMTNDSYSTPAKLSPGLGQLFTDIVDAIVD